MRHVYSWRSHTLCMHLLLTNGASPMDILKQGLLAAFLEERTLLSAFSNRRNGWKHRLCTRPCAQRWGEKDESASPPLFIKALRT